MTKNREKLDSTINGLEEFNSAKEDGSCFVETKYSTCDH